jgi:hypothetical protein
MVSLQMFAIQQSLGEEALEVLYRYTPVDRGLAKKSDKKVIVLLKPLV